MLIFFENFTMGVLEVIGGLVELLWAFLCLLFWGGLLVLVVALMIAFYRMEYKENNNIININKVSIKY